MSEVKWIKITTNVFNDEKIQLIESMPDSDTLIVIWFKLLALAGRCNNGGIITINDNTPYTDDMLATLFRRKKTVVTLALNTFKAFGMIEIYDDVIAIVNWEKHQNVDGLERIRENTRLRVQKYRDKQKNLIEHKEEEKEKEVDKERDIESNVSVTLHNVIDYLNTKIGSKYTYKATTTVKHIKARVNDGFTLDDFNKVIDIKVAEWGNTDMAKFLRPETLFGTKFESYLNQPTKKEESIYDYLPKE